MLFPKKNAAMPTQSKCWFVPIRLCKKPTNLPKTSLLKLNILFIYTQNQNQSSLINDFLIALRSDGIKVAIASNKDDYAVKALAAEYFGGCVDIAVGATRNNPLKPHPYMIDFVSEKLSVPKSKLAYVGDSEVDLLTAANSGVDGYIVDWGYALNKNFDTVRSFDDLYKLLIR